MGYRVVQQQSLGLNDDEGDNPDDAESSDDERAGYPTLPVDGIGSRPSVNSLRHVSFHVGSYKQIEKKMNIKLHTIPNC